MQKKQGNISSIHIYGDKMKIGFAITCYNKFEEAKILFDIIRKEFDGDYPISFCSNHPDGKQFAEENNVDVFTAGRDLSISPPRSKTQYADPRWKNNHRDHTVLRMRAADSVQKSCKAALSFDVDYIIHMHSDAWVLDEKALHKFIEQIHKRKKMLAIRGDGLERVDYVRTPSSACGHLDDHFFAFNRKYFKEHHIFDFIPEELFPHKYSVHGMLMMVFVVKVGLHNIWYYRFLKDLVCYDNKKMKIKNVKPSVYDETYHFVHIHRNSFPGDFGKRIQALYLKSHNLGKSPLIKNFINAYYDPSAVPKLLKIEKELDKKLKHRLFPYETTHKREITIKQQLLNNCTTKTILQNMIFPLKRFALKKFFPYHANIPHLYENELQIDTDWAGDIYG